MVLDYCTWGYVFLWEPRSGKTEGLLTMGILSARKSNTSGWVFCFCFFNGKHESKRNNKDVEFPTDWKEKRPVLSAPEVSRTNSEEISVWMWAVSHFYTEEDLMPTSFDSLLTSSQNSTCYPLGRVTQPLHLLLTDFYYMKTVIEKLSI